METIYFVIIFIILFTIYLHILSELKKSNNLEIYESDYKSYIEFQETCLLKKPFITNFDKFEFNNSIAPIQEFKIKDCLDKNKAVYLPYSNIDTLLKNDSKSHYYSENNYEFSNENENFYKFNPYLKPRFNTFSTFDYLFGSKNAFTNTKYHISSFMFLYVEEGSISIKMIPPKFEKKLDFKYDSENFEYVSEYDLWNSKEIQTLDFDIKKQNILFIPPYWIYSIKFGENAIVYSFRYHSIFNNILHIPKYCNKVFNQIELPKNPASSKSDL